MYRTIAKIKIWSTLDKDPDEAISEIIKKNEIAKFSLKPFKPFHLQGSVWPTGARLITLC